MMFIRRRRLLVVIIVPANEQKVPESAELMTILYFKPKGKAQKPVIRQRIFQLNTSNLFLQKILKTVIKYIARNPAGVVQHGIIAGYCVPLIFLFITAWCLFISVIFLSNCNHFSVYLRLEKQILW